MKSRLFTNSTTMKRHKILLCQLDGKIPNIALMRIASHYAGHDVELRRCPTISSVERQFWDEFDLVYGSLIFERTRPVAERLKQIYSDAIIGGTGWDLATTLEGHGIKTKRQDYTLYPKWKQSIGFTQRGCRLKCSFCVVPKKEGSVTEEQTISELWRGEPWPRELILLDNDFFGQPNWESRIAEIKDGSFKVSFNQGINVRMITDETAKAIASVDYRDDQMKTKRIYTAWDNKKDEKRLFAGLEALVRHGVKPDHIMVYMLIGFWKGETDADWEYRRHRLREFGAKPYPMPFVRNKATVGFQRFCVGAYDKRITWNAWKVAQYDPRKLGPRNHPQMSLACVQQPK